LRDLDPDAFFTFGNHIFPTLKAGAYFLTIRPPALPAFPSKHIFPSPSSPVHKETSGATRRPRPNLRHHHSPLGSFFPFSPVLYLSFLIPKWTISPPPPSFKKTFSSPRPTVDSFFAPRRSPPPFFRGRIFGLFLRTTLGKRLPSFSQNPRLRFFDRSTRGHFLLPFSEGTSDPSSFFFCLTCRPLPPNPVSSCRPFAVIGPFSSLFSYRSATPTCSHANPDSSSPPLHLPGSTTRAIHP